jgi:hypothetical protein
MRIGISVALALSCCLAAAQAPATPPPTQSQNPTQNPNQTKPVEGQKPPASAPKPTEANPFPEDTTTVPVMPDAHAPADAPAWDGTNPAAAVPGEDNDPIRSPESPLAGDSSSGSSSSLSGLDRAINPPEDAKGKDSKKPPEHQETAAEDETVGGYYLSTKNWKAALSRYQSALVLDPENPEVYWGLAEAERHLGDLANAKANYAKVVEYDPDSRRGKDARKALKDPELSGAPTASVARPGAANRP